MEPQPDWDDPMITLLSRDWYLDLSYQYAGAPPISFNGISFANEYADHSNVFVSPYTLYVLWKYYYLENKIELNKTDATGYYTIPFLEQSKELGPEIKASATANVLINYHLQCNPGKIDAIRNGFSNKFKERNKDKNFYVFIPVILLNLYSSDWNKELKSNHANGIFLVIKPDNTKWLIHIEPDLVTDANPLRKTVITIAQQILEDKNFKVLGLSDGPQAYFEGDGNCIYWTRYVAKLLIDFFEANKETERDLVSKNMKCYVIADCQNETTLKNKITAYKLQTFKNIVPTIEDGLQLVSKIYQNPRYKYYIGNGAGADRLTDTSLTVVDRLKLAFILRVKRPRKLQTSKEYIDSEVKDLIPEEKKEIDYIVKLMSQQGGRRKKTKRRRQRFRTKKRRS